MKLTNEALDAIRRAEAEGRVTSSPVPALPLGIDEDEFMRRVINFARSRGWKVYHTRDSRRSDPGFPDLILIRRYVLVVELKIAKGRTTAAQAEWLAAFRAADVPAVVWRPADWPRIQEVLA